MTTVTDYMNKLKKINVPTLVSKTIKENEQEIIGVNQQELSQGRNYLGEIVGTYSKATELLSKKTNPRKPKKAGKPFNHEDTGDLFDKMFIKYRGNKITIDSKGKGDDDKKIFVENNDLLGFDNVSGNIINYEILLPNLQKKIKRLLG